MQTKSSDTTGFDVHALLDRDKQLHYLQRIAEAYPEPVPTFEWSAEDPLCYQTLHYLSEHGLIEGTLNRPINGRGRYIEAKATARGLDFLSKDGGLSAVLGIVEIRLHDDTVKSLIALKIHEASLPAHEKQRYLDLLRELPAESTKHLVLKLLDLGLEKGQVAISALGSFLMSQLS